MKPARLVEHLSVRTGIVVPKGVGVYTFPHRSFQEYLAACYLTDEDYPDKMAELVRNDPNRWREVVLLAGAKAARGAKSTIWSLVEALCYKEFQKSEIDISDIWGALFAGQFIAETANLKSLSEPNKYKVERVKQWLLEIIAGSQLPAVERVLAGGCRAAYRFRIVPVNRFVYLGFRLCLLPGQK